MQSISLNSRLIANPELMSSEVGSEIVTFDMVKEKYFGMNEVASRVFSLCDGNRSLAQISSMLAEEFDVQPEECETAVLELSKEFLSKTLVTAIS